MGGGKGWQREGGDAERMEWRGWKGQDGRKDEEGERRNARCNGGGAEVGGESIGSGGWGWRGGGSGRGERI